MTRRLPQNTAFTIMLKVFSNSDHISPSSGSTVGVKISKAGAAFINPNAGATNAAEVDSTNGPGWYKYSADSTDLNTLGDFVIRATATSCDPSEQVCMVVAATAAVNMTQIAGVAVDTTSPQLGVRVNNIVANAVDTTSAQLGVRLVNIGASAIDTTSPQLGVRVVNIGASAVDTTSAQLGVRVNVITSGSINSVADGLLDRDMSVGGDTGSTTTRTVRQSLRFLRNKWTISAGSLSVFKEDDSTVSWTAAVTTDSTALPIVTNDPAG